MKYLNLILVAMALSLGSCATSGKSQTVTIEREGIECQATIAGDGTPTEIICNGVTVYPISPLDK